jgi:hypothetical protein
MWYCSQWVYHRTFDYTTGMSLARTSRAFLSHSEEMLVLSTEMSASLQQQPSNHQFARVPVFVRRYGIHARLRSWPDERARRVAVKSDQ